MDFNKILQDVDLMEYMVKYAQSKGASQAEVFRSEEYNKRVQIEKGKITVLQNTVDSGAFLRIKKGKMMGSFIFTDLSREGVKNAVKEALRLAKVEDPNTSFPEPKGSQGIHLNVDKKANELSSEDIIDLSNTLINTVKEKDKRINPADGLFSVNITSTTIVNSNGISVTDVGSKLISSMRTILKTGSRVGNGYDYSISRSCYDIHPEEVGTKSAELALNSINKKKIISGKYPVVFDPHAFADIIKALILPAVYGINVKQKASFLHERIGTQVFGETITIIDDGTLINGVNRCYMDHEGTPTQKTILFNKGKLEKLLYDNVTAQKNDEHSTGNGIRYLSPQFDKMYRYIPSTEGTNTVLSHGSRTRDELIGSVNEGLLVTFLVGSWSFNFSSGTYAAEARNCFKIEKGKITHAVDEASIYGNIIELFEGLELGRNLTQSRGCIPLTPAVAFIPTVLASNVNVGA